MVQTRKEILDGLPRWPFILSGLFLDGLPNGHGLLNGHPRRSLALPQWPHSSSPVLNGRDSTAAPSNSKAAPDSPEQIHGGSKVHSGPPPILGGINRTIFHDGTRPHFTAAPESTMAPGLSQAVRLLLAGLVEQRPIPRRIADPRRTFPAAHPQRPPAPRLHAIPAVPTFCGQLWSLPPNSLSFNGFPQVSHNSMTSPRWFPFAVALGLHSDLRPAIQLPQRLFVA